MAKDYPRSYRVADQIQREITLLIRTELKDHRVSPLLTISGVEVSKDLSIAKIFFTVLDEEHRDETSDALKQATGFLRRKLSGRMTMRSVPEIRFMYDHSLEHGAHMSSVIDSAIKSNTTDEDS